MAQFQLLGMSVVSCGFHRGASLAASISTVWSQALRCFEIGLNTVTAYPLQQFQLLVRNLDA
jgi:hypothetical protein